MPTLWHGVDSNPQLKSTCSNTLNYSYNESRHLFVSMVAEQHVVVTVRVARVDTNKIKSIDSRKRQC